MLCFIFFIWGFITSLNDILVPHLKQIFDLNYTQVMLIQFIFFSAYFIVSQPSGIIVAKYGYRQAILLGLLTSALGALLFYPAAGMLSYPVFLAALFILASGITLLQVAANPYVTLLGNPETSASRLNLAQAFNSLGTSVAPLFGASFILTDSMISGDIKQLPSQQVLQAYRLQEAASVQITYLGLAIVLVILVIVIGNIKLPLTSYAKDRDTKPEKVLGILKNSQVVLGAIGIFSYVGAEVSIGSFLIGFLGQDNIVGLDKAIAAKYVSYYWGSAMIGRFLGSGLLQKIKPGNLLGTFAFIASGLVIIAASSSGQIAMWSILSVGLFNSIMFPTIFALAIDGLGKMTSQASSILVMAIVGGSIMPLTQGIMADAFGIQKAFILSAACYLYIVYYGFFGSNKKTKIDI